MSNQGIIIEPVVSDVVYPVIFYSNPIAFDINTVLDIKINARQTIFDDFYDVVREIYDPGYFNLKYQIKLDTSGTDYYLFFNGTNYEWSTTVNDIRLVMERVLNLSINLPALPVSGSIIISVYKPQKSFNEVASNVLITLIDIINKNNSDSITGAIGEFHTVQRQDRPSSISTDTTQISNGDSPTLLYEGAIFKNNETDATTSWSRRDKVENKPILRISAEDILRIRQKPQKVFTGDIYGYMSYLSVISIDNLEGKFLPIEWSFDALRNTTTVKLLQFFGDELNDIDYKFTLDYGNTVKPTITS